MVKKNEAILNKILKSDKDFEKVVPLKLDEGLTLKRSTSIGKRKIKALLKDLVLAVKFSNDNNLDLLKTNAQTIEYLNFLIVKYFTNLEEALEGQDFYVNMDTFIKLDDKGYLDKALLEIGQSNVNKVAEAFNNFAVNLINLNAETDEILKGLNEVDGENIPES